MSKRNRGRPSEKTRRNLNRQLNLRIDKLLEKYGLGIMTTTRGATLIEVAWAESGEIIWPIPATASLV